MAYIGKTPTVGNFQKCDAISVVNGQAAYTLQVGGSNVSPESPNHVLVSLNGILQAPTDSYTISGSTLTFASNLATGDVIDFVILLGNVLDLGTPSDNTVSLAKLTASGTKDATTFLRGDNTFASTQNMWEFISQSTASSSSNIDFTSFSTDFKDFCVEIQSCRHATDNTYPHFRIFDSGGSVVSSSSPGYQWVYHGRSTSVYSTAQNSSQGEITYAPQIGNASSEGLNGFIYLYNVHDTGDQYKQFMFMNSSHNPTGNIMITHGCGAYKASAATISGIRLLTSSGNIATGNFALYGRKRA